LVIDTGTQENDAVHHESREDIHLGHVQRALFNDVWCHGRFDIMIYRHAADAHMFGCVFAKFVAVHILYLFKVSKLTIKVGFIVEYNTKKNPEFLQDF
jgi:hypothetical protein